MHKLFTRLAVAATLVVALALPGFAGELDDYYLSAFGVKPGGTALEKAILSPAVATGETRRCGTPLKHGLKRDWNKLEPATQKVLLAAQVNVPPTLPKVLTSSGGHFSIHYSDTFGDPNTPNIGLLKQYDPGLVLTSVADWVGQVGTAFEYAFTYYQGLGWHMPPMNNTNTYDIYLVDLAGAGEYGETDDIQTVATSGFPYASSSYIEVDKDFTSSVFHPQTYTPLQSLQVTSAHEFHHAIQYGYNFYFDVWYAEVTSTWMEDETHDSVNQLYDYLPSYLLSASTISLNAAPDGSSEYGRWIFNRYLAEKHNTPAVVKSIWTALPTIAPVNNNDIPMAPVIDSVLSTSYGSSLGADFFGFAKRIYKRDWTTHPADLAVNLPTYSALASYSSYPVTSAGLPTPSLTLPHYSFAFFKFVPASGSASLTISLAQTSGIKTAVFEKSGGNIAEIAANTDGTSYTISDFGTLNAASDEVVLLVANTGSSDNQILNFSTDGTPKAVPTASKSSGGGCFIATAAYGSYMHPKVAELREFRDRYLLTNAPGRLFVALYYRLSPPIANVIAQHAWMRAGVRVGLMPVVLAVENPVLALLVFLLSGGGVVWRLTRRYRFAQLAKGSC